MNGCRRVLVCSDTEALQPYLETGQMPLALEMAARTLAILIIAAGFWATEVLPLFATAFVAIGLEILLLASDGGLADTLT